VDMKILICALVIGSLFSQAAAAQQGSVAVLARSGIDAGNEAWIEGGKERGRDAYYCNVRRTGCRLRSYG